MLRAIKRFVQHKPDTHLATLDSYIKWQTSRELPDEVEGSTAWMTRFNELRDIGYRETGGRAEYIREAAPNIGSKN